MTKRTRTITTGIALLVLGLAAAPSPATPTKPDAELTLEDITIEGNVSVPQVLFITARDQMRFMDDLHRRYLPTALALGQRTVLPIVVTVDLAPRIEGTVEHD